MKSSIRQSCLAAAILANQVLHVTAWGTTTENVTYVLPIYEGLLASNDRNNDVAILQGMKDMLGTGGSGTVLGFSFSSWSLSRDVDDNNDYAFSPTNLNYALGIAKDLSLPILIHANNGRWADCCTSNSDGGWDTTFLNYIAAQPNTVMVDQSGNSQYHSDAGGDFLSLSRLNKIYRDYKKRNVMASMSTLMSWADANPSLFVGVSLDSETIYPATGVDYGVFSNQEWAQWLQNTGIYGSGGDFFGQGRVPAFSSIDDFNSAMGTSFTSWDALSPPASLTSGETFSEEWHRWRITQINHAIGDVTDWIAQAGVPRDLIYGHQTPEMNFYAFADDWSTHTAANGAGGFTAYGRQPAQFGNIDNPLRASSKNNWGIFELNALSNDAQFASDTLLTLYNDGIKVICPNAFENVTNKDQYAIFGSPNYGDTFGNALKDFLSHYADTERNLSPAPWAPGKKVYDLYDNFGSATSSGPDNHLASSGTSGNAPHKTIYEAVGGSISFSTKFPSVSNGERLNFWTAIGIKDGAGSGGISTFQVTINGNALFGDGMALPPTYWIWKHWVPVMVDVTAWAGEDVTIILTTSGQATYGWTQWGAPAVYQTTDETINLALGKTVSTSSSSEGAGWGAKQLTDGNIEGGSSGNGWSSQAQSSNTAAEWASVDLGSTQDIGKVVLFSRSDLGTVGGTGFPSSFKVQGSTDGSTWNTILDVQDYPRSKAGQGEILTFEKQSVQYVRVYATELGGVGGESDYRFQLAELEVYAA